MNTVTDKSNMNLKWTQGPCGITHINTFFLFINTYHSALGTLNAEDGGRILNGKSISTE
jgi:hypothetical protein